MSHLPQSFVPSPFDRGTSDEWPSHDLLAPPPPPSLYIPMQPTPQHQQGHPFDPTTGQMVSQLYPSYMLTPPPPLDQLKSPNMGMNPVPHNIHALGVPPPHSAHFNPAADWNLAALQAHNSSLMQLHPYHHDPYSLQKRHSLSTDPVKHRRTRSGCFTCRNRRVKCDETHPICDRCRKGNRDCAYPDVPASKSKKFQSASPPTSYDDLGSHSIDSISEDPNEELSPSSAFPSPSQAQDTKFNDDSDFASLASAETSQFLEPMVDDPSEEHSFLESPAKPGLELSNHSILTDNGSSTASNENTPALCLTVQSPDLFADWELNVETERLLAGFDLFQPPVFTSSSPPDLLSSNKIATIQYYLQFFQQHITYFHYGARQDSDAFLKSQFLNLTVQHTHLLYAVLAFSAYFHSVTFGAPDIAVFATFQTLSLRALRESMSTGTGLSLPTLLCVLQLAKLEDVTGNWNTLSHHRKAARWMITNWFTLDDMGNLGFVFALEIFLNIDFSVGCVMGDMSCLDGSWHQSLREVTRTQQPISDTDYDRLYIEAYSSLRWSHADTVNLLSTILQHPDSSIPDILHQVELLEEKVVKLQDVVYYSLLDTSYLEPAVTKVGGGSSTPFGTRLRLFLGPLYRTNLLLMDVWMWSIIFCYQAILILHRIQETEQTLMMKNRLRSKLVHLTVQCCCLLESVHSHSLSHRPAGFLIALGPVTNIVTTMMSSSLQSMSLIGTGTYLKLSSEMNNRLASIVGYEIDSSHDGVGSYPITGQGGDIAQWLCAKLTFIEKTGYHLPSSTWEALQNEFNIPNLDEVVDGMINQINTPHPDLMVHAASSVSGDLNVGGGTGTTTTNTGAGFSNLSLEVPAPSSLSAAMSPCSSGFSPVSSPGLTASPVDLSGIVSQELRAYIRNRANPNGE